MAAALLRERDAPVPLEDVKDFLPQPQDIRYTFCYADPKSLAGAHAEI